MRTVNCLYKTDRINEREQMNDFALKEKKKKNTFITVSFAAAAVVAVLAFVYNFTLGVKVSTAQVNAGEISSVIAVTGTVKPGLEKAYYSFVQARVTAVNVKPGDTVNAGDVLATFESSQIDAEVSRAKYQADTATAAVINRNTAVRILNSAVTALDNQISLLSKELGVSNVSLSACSPVYAVQASAFGANPVFVAEKNEGTIDGVDGADSETAALFNAAQAQTESKINSLLNSSERVSEREMSDAIVDAIKNAQNSLQNTMTNASEKSRKQLQLALLKQQRNILAAQVPSIEEISKLQEASQSALQAYQTVNTQATELKNGWSATFSGIVSQVNIREGGMAPSDKAGIVIVDKTQMVVNVDLGKYDAGKVQPGQIAYVYIDGNKLSATVSSVSPIGVEKDGDTVLPCNITLDSPDERLIIGFDVDVDIRTEYIQYALYVPSEAVLTDEYGKYCFTYDAQTRTVTKVYVGVGIMNEYAYQIIYGLNQGEVVIVNPPSGLKDGERVRMLKHKNKNIPGVQLTQPLYKAQTDWDNSLNDPNNNQSDWNNEYTTWDYGTTDYSDDGNTATEHFTTAGNVSYNAARLNNNLSDFSVVK